MQPEREYLTRVIFPRLRKLCEARGVFFYAIDLRWGVTEEETQENRTIQICLEQIKQCIPYFIGLIGNRYGWVPENGGLVDKYPWLTKYPGISATEIEFRYYLQESKEQKNRSFFAVKGDALLDPGFDDGQQERIQALTQTVAAETGAVPFVYHSLQELGEAVYKNILTMLDQKFPVESCTRGHILQQYIQQMEAYDESYALEDLERENWQSGGNRFLFARRDPTNLEMMARVNRYEHMILRETPDMEQLCNRYLWQELQGQGDTIFLMLDAGQWLRTPLGILEELCDQLKSHTPEGGSYSWTEHKAKGVDRLRQYMTLAVAMLQDIQKEKKLRICITGLHLLDRNSPWYGLSFLAPFLRSGVRLLLTTADPEQTFLLERLGVVCRNFPIRLENSEKAGAFASLLRSLELEGKHLDKVLALALLENGAMKDMESAAFVGNYLKNYVIFEELSPRIRQLIELCGQMDAYSAVWQISLKRLEETEHLNQQKIQCVVQMAGRIFRVVTHARLCEADLDRIFTQTGTSRVGYLEALELLRPFLTYDGTGLGICNPTCQQVLDEIWKDTPSCLEEGFVDLGLEKLGDAWDDLDDQYALVGYLYDHGDSQQLIRLVTDNRWLEFAAAMDPQLIRMAWRALEKLGALDVEKIYTDSGHLNESGRFAACRDVYDILMRMELAVVGTDLFECFLDIPYAYSTDSEKELKRRWSNEDWTAVNTLARQANEQKTVDLREFFQDYAEKYGVNPYAAVYMWEILCRTFAQRKELTEEDKQHYLWFAAQVGALRLLADAMQYWKAQTGLFRLLH